MGWEWKNGIVFATAPLASEEGCGVRGPSHLLHEGGAETPNAPRTTCYETSEKPEDEIMIAEVIGISSVWVIAS